MPQTKAQQESSFPVNRVNKLITELYKQKLQPSFSTQRDIFDEQAGEEIANPDLSEYKKTSRS
tara:strand:- start:732 stop:920 length:189 start_codon:yes stop_codon:yes gene_type:complete